MDRLESAYRLAAAVGDATECMTALLVDDFDLSVASTFDGVRVTVNTQLLSGFLMNLADDPTHCGQHELRRVPIILTGNNFTALYGPLTRHGRMNFYEWKPNLDERKAMVAAMFKGVLTSVDELYLLDELVEAYRHQPLSFFAALKDDVANEAVLELLAEPSLPPLPELQMSLMDVLGGVTVAQLMEMAEQRVRRVAKAYV